MSRELRILEGNYTNETNRNISLFVCLFTHLEKWANADRYTARVPAQRAPAHSTNGKGETRRFETKSHAQQREPIESNNSNRIKPFVIS